MLCLLPNSPNVVPRYLMNPDRIGFLLTPTATRRTFQDVLANFSWAVDNEMYACWATSREFDMDRYMRFLNSIREYPGRCLFVVVPDFPGDHDRTLERYYDYAPAIKQMGFPVAFAAQNGLKELPADLEYDALFIGGTNHYRFSGDLIPVVQQAKSANKWIHLGRCNTRNGIEIAKRLEVDSFDGTKSAIDRKELSTILAWAQALTMQEDMF